jgi:hypothetical protein
MVMCGKTSYSYATGKFSMRNHLLLDNQSLVHVFCNPQFVSNVRSAERQLKLTSNGGNLPISEVADFDGFNKEVWYSEDAITIILSLSLVKHEYSISYDGEDFIIHQAKHGYADMVFKPHPSGLHVYDPDDPQGHASYSFAKTVEENMAMITKCQISEKAQPRNSLAPRTQGALALGTSGNVQGGHKFHTLNTGMVVVQRNWKVLPMPPSVTDRIHSKAQGQPAQPIFADQHGKPIGDFPMTIQWRHRPLMMSLQE